MASLFCEIFFVFYRIYNANMTKFKNKYRIEPARLEGYDYSLQGMYFITICTGGRKHFFGDIKNGEMYLSEVGKIAYKQWFKTLEIRKDMNLQLHEFVVMPNHIHGIIEIGDNKYNDKNTISRRDAMLGVSHKEDDFGISQKGKMFGVLNKDEKHQVHSESNPIVNSEYKNTFSSQSKNIASIIRGYKSAVTIDARRVEGDFLWQTRFYDHVVRDQDDYRRITNYIIANPENWKEDKFFLP